MKRWMLFIPLIGFVVIAAVFWIMIGRDNKDVLPSPLVGKPFPAFNMVVLETGDLTSDEVLKGEPLLVNVWATWCPTCKAEHEFLNQLSAQGVRIVGINYKDEEDAAKNWLTRYGNPYQLNISDPDGKLGLDLGVYGAPETFLVDANGVIRAKHVGDLNATVWSTFKNDYEALK